MNILKSQIVSLIVTTPQVDEKFILKHLKEIHDWANESLESFELIVVSDPSISISERDKSQFISSHHGMIWINLGSISNREVQTTAGLDAAVGDVTIEIRATIDSISDLSALQSKWDSNDHDEVIVCRLNRVGVLNSLLSRLAGYEVAASDCGLRLASREALQPWIMRKDRHKSVRLAHYLAGREIAYVLYKEKPKYRKPRGVRESIRAVVQVTPNPLRWAAYLGILGSLLSLTWAVLVLSIGLRNDVVEGWTTTNLQISTLFFFSSLVLSILAEYVYQISATSSRTLPYRIKTEITSPVFPLRETANVEFIKYSDPSDD
jgi:hypothetical protein